MKLTVATPKINSLWKSQMDEIVSKHPTLEVAGVTTPDDPSVAGSSIIMGTMISRQLLELAGNVEVVAVPFAGVNHLPLDYLAERDVRLANAHANARFVAERVLALTLGYFGKLVPYHLELEQEEWNGFSVNDPVTESWDSIVGMRVAIIGAGAIGEWSARMFKLFDCRVVGYRRTPLEAQAPFDEMTTDLHAALEGAQIVVNALPLTPQTEGVLDTACFSRMTGALFVNVGRGAVADEKALYDALTDGTLRGAAIDTWFNYPAPGSRKQAPSNYPIHKLDNVLLSPHLGGYTPKAVAASIAEIFRKVDHYLSYGELPEAVSLEKQY